VVVADYEGLGTTDTHPYLVSESEGRSVLDALRAAPAIDDAGIESTAPVVMWGFSQGGHAALAAADLAPTYAPSIDLLALAVTAPVADPAQFAERAETRPDQVGVTVTITYGLAAAYPELDPSEILTPEALAELDQLDELCIGEVVQLYNRPVDDVLIRSPRLVQEWADRLDENLTALRPIGVPVLVVQGDADEIVFPEVSEDLVARLCANGDTVEYQVVPGARHGDIAPATVIEWLSDRLEGLTVDTSC
jgi:pimeloyl-ACP methyl ester carboxylesterase